MADFDIVDTHAHIYAPNETKYPPIAKPLRPPGGKGSLEDLKADMEATGVSAACIIQTSSFYRFDNRYICDSSAAAPDWAAGVVTLNPEDPHTPGLLHYYVKRYGIKGVRSNPASDGRIDHPSVRVLWRAASEAGIVVNLHIQPALAEQANRVLADFPALPVVLDHSLYPKVGPNLPEILTKVRLLAKHKNLHAKLSFIATGSKTAYPCADMHQTCLDVIDAFGPERCVWGSDFPCELWTPRVSYAEAVRIFQEDLPLNSEARRRILGATARRLWFERA